MSGVNKSEIHSGSSYALKCAGVTYQIDREIRNSLYVELKSRLELNNSIAILLGDHEIGILPELMVKEVLEDSYENNQPSTEEEDVTVKLLQKLNEHLVNCSSD